MLLSEIASAHPNAISAAIHPPKHTSTHSQTSHTCNIKASYSTFTVQYRKAAHNRRAKHRREKTTYMYMHIIHNRKQHRSVCCTVDEPPCRTTTIGYYVDSERKSRGESQSNRLTITYSICTPLNVREYVSIND